MNIETQIRAWKDPKFRRNLDTEVAANPAGARLVEMNDSELQGVWGAAAAPSEGYVCSWSGECNGTGESCWSL